MRLESLGWVRAMGIWGASQDNQCRGGVGTLDHYGEGDCAAAEGAEVYSPY